MPKQAFPITVAMIASPAILFGAPSAAQGPTGQASTICELHEDLPEGAQLKYQSAGPPSEAPIPNVVWSSGPANPIRLRLLYLPVQGALLAVKGQATYTLGSEPQSDGYKLVFDFNGAGPRATLSPETGVGNIRTWDFGPPDTHRVEGFAHAGRVTAIVYEGDRQVAKTTFELAPDRLEPGLSAFARRVKANDPSVCRSSYPPLPVPPFPRE